MAFNRQLNLLPYNHGISSLSFSKYFEDRPTDERTKSLIKTTTHRIKISLKMDEKSKEVKISCYISFRKCKRFLILDLINWQRFLFEDMEKGQCFPIMHLETGQYFVIGKDGSVQKIRLDSIALYLCLRLGSNALFFTCPFIVIWKYCLISRTQLGNVCLFLCL